MWHPGPPWVWSCIYHFHLMFECCCEHLTLWLLGSDYTEFMMDSLGHWQLGEPPLSYSVSPRPNSRQRAVFHKERSYPLMIAELYFKILSVLWFIYRGCQRLQRAFLFATDAPRTIGSAGPSKPSGRVFSTRPSLVLCSTENWHLLLHSALLRHFLPFKLFFLPSLFFHISFRGLREVKFKYIKNEFSRRNLELVHSTPKSIYLTSILYASL